MDKENLFFKSLNLYIDEVFVEEKYPILFTCRNKSDSLFICVCYEIREKLQFIVSKNTKENIIDMLKNKITLREVFDSPFDKVFLVDCYKSNFEFTTKVKYKDIDSDLLPIEGTYLESEEGEFKDYILKLSNKIN